jgi:hypothetical protein
MVRKLILPLLTAISLAFQVAPATAGCCDAIGRYLGLGVGEGYHAHDQCPRPYYGPTPHHGRPQMVWPEPINTPHAPFAPAAFAPAAYQPAATRPPLSHTGRGDSAHLPSQQQTPSPVYRFR